MIGNIGTKHKNETDKNGYPPDKRITNRQTGIHSPDQIEGEPRIRPFLQPSVAGNKNGDNTQYFCDSEKRKEVQRVTQMLCEFSALGVVHEGSDSRKKH